MVACLRGVGVVYEAAHRVLYDVLVVAGTRLPCVAAIMVAIILLYSWFRHSRGARGWGAWPTVLAVLALYGFSAACAPGGWDEPLVLLGVMFAALSGYAWLDPARRTPSGVAADTSGRRGWFG